MSKVLPWNGPSFVMSSGESGHGVEVYEVSDV